MMALSTNTHAAIITVDVGGEGFVANHCSLRAAMVSASQDVPVNSCVAGSGADTIRFAAGLTDFVLTDGELQVAQALTLDGGTTQVTIRRDPAAAAFRIINVTQPVQLSLSRITISGGRTTWGDGWGAGINSAGNLVLVNSTLSGNTTTRERSGGGGASVVGTVTLVDSIVSGNATGGVFDSPGGGIYSHGNISATRSVISGNSTVASESGGAGLRSYGGVVTLTDSQVYGNTTSGRESNGGGVSATTINAVRSIIRDNQVSGDFAGGGGLAATAVSVTGSTIANNAVLSTAGDESLSKPSGGGIYAFSSAVVVGSTISGNRVAGGGGNAASFTLHDGGDGGGIFAKYDVTLINSTVSGNAAGDEGGGIFANKLTMHNSSVVFNDSRKYGECGGIYLWDADASATALPPNALTLTSSIVYGNSGATGDICRVNTDPDGLPVTGHHNLVRNAPAGVMPAGTLACDPKLDFLGNYGGATQTHRLLPGSCALNTGSNTGQSLPNDQRGSGFPRVVGGIPDIGAFEFNDIIFRNGFD